jgi:quinol monooxygenase YgiN
MNSTRPKIPKLKLFALTGLLIATCNNFFPSDRQVLAQTTKIKKMTTQLAQINNNYPPFVPAPETATPVIVTVELIAKDPVVLEQHLKSADVIPTTRLASGINSSWTVHDTANPNRFVLIQQWNSAEQQSGYIAWREERGDMAQLRELLTQDPVVSYLALTDINTLPAQAE